MLKEYLLEKQELMEAGTHQGQAKYLTFTKHVGFKECFDSRNCSQSFALASN